MVASRFWGLLNVARAILLVAGLIVSVAVFALAIDVPALRSLYSFESGFVPGHWVALQLNHASGKEGRTCLFVGTSVVREGFDSDVLSEAAGGEFEVTNIATTAPLASTGVLELQAQIARDRGVKFECVVLGFNSHYLHDLSDVSYELLATNYLSQLPIWSLLQLSNLDQVMPQFPEALARSLYPLGRHSVILQRRLRRAVSLMHQRTLGRLPLAEFEVLKGEFTPAIQFMYDGQPSVYKAAVELRREEIESDNLAAPSLYDGAAPRAAYRRTIHLLSEITDNLIVLSMPLTHVYEPVEEAARPSFEKASAGLPIDAFVDCRFPLGDEESVFHDSGHLNAAGRQWLSEEFGIVIRGLIDGQATISSLCITKQYPRHSSVSNPITPMRSIAAIAR